MYFFNSTIKVNFLLLFRPVLIVYIEINYVMLLHIAGTKLLVIWRIIYSDRLDYFTNLIHTLRMNSSSFYQSFMHCFKLWKHKNPPPPRLLKNQNYKFFLNLVVFYYVFVLNETFHHNNLYNICNLEWMLKVWKVPHKFCNFSDFTVLWLLFIIMINDLITKMQFLLFLNFRSTVK